MNNIDKISIIKQGIDICVNQIEYTEFGLEESKDNTYLISSISIINHLLENCNSIVVVNKQKILSLLNKINIDYGRE